MIDVFTINLVVAVVTITAAVLYLLESILRREIGPGRMWALGFLSGVLTVVSYLVWRGSSDPWIAIAIGNAALVGVVGFFWLGCRSFNERPLRVAAVVMGALVLVVLVVTLSGGPDAGDWAGSEVMFGSIGVLAMAGAVESRRGAMGAMWSSLGVTVVLVLVSLYYFARTVVLIVDGADGLFFQTWFGSGVTGIVSIVLTIVVLTTATMLRSGRVTMRREAFPATLEVDSDGLLSARSLRTALSGVVGRAERGLEPLAVVSLRIEDLSQIAIAFGADEQASISAHHREGVRRYAPTISLVGEGCEGGVVVAFAPPSEAEARRVASRVQRRLLDDFAARGSAVIPVVGVGVATAQQVGYDADALIDAAEDAARRSATSAEASVVVAEGGPAFRA